MNNLREIAYRVDPVLWVRRLWALTPAPWQQVFLRAARGASILALTARQVGKTTTAAWAIAHCMMFYTGIVVSDRLSGATPECGSGTARARGSDQGRALKFKSENVYGLELENGSRVLALPSSDDFIRGLTVDGWIVADEAARLTEDMIAALRPMRARRPQARLCNAVNGMEPHRSVLDRMGER